jgi:short subunit dehydrogenase-like uncharacterized protein
MGFRADMTARPTVTRRCRVMIYGANGFTGSLIVGAARELGFDLVLAGRDAERIKAIAHPFGFSVRAFALDDLSRVTNALTDVAVVLNAAGPMVATVHSLIAACLQTGTHYLDVTGELSVFVAAHHYDGAARRRGIMIMPGVGFWIVASDCLAADVSALVPGAKYLRLGCSRSESLSRGSLRTVFSETRGHILIRRAGRLRSVPIGSLERQFDYGTGERASTTVSLADVFTAFFTTGIPNIEGYLEVGLLDWTAGLLALRVAAAARATPLWPLLELGLAAWPERPSRQTRGMARQVIVAEAEDGWRRSRRIRMTTSDGYSFTAAAATAVLRRMISGELEFGFQTPGKLYGPGLALGIPGTLREDLDARPLSVRHVATQKKPDGKRDGHIY